MGRFNISASLMRSVLLGKKLLKYTIDLAQNSATQYQKHPVWWLTLLLYQTHSPWCNTSFHEVQKNTSQFQSEYAFQAEVYAILRDALCTYKNPRWVVRPEAKSNFMTRQKRVDILVKN